MAKNWQLSKTFHQNPKDLDIKEVDAAPTASTLSSVDATANNSYAQAAKLITKQHFTKKQLTKTQINGSTLLQPQKDWKKSDKAKAIKTLISVYQTDEVGKVIQDASNNVDIPAWKGAKVSSKD